MKNLFKVLGLAVMLGLVFTSCEKEELKTENQEPQKLEFSTEELKTDFVPKKTAYTVEWDSIKAKVRPYNWRFYPIHDMEIYYSVIVTSTTGEKQEWLLVNVASGNISQKHIRTGDPNGEIYGFYYKWAGGADLSYADIKSAVFDDVNSDGFHIPTSDDIYKLYRIVGSREECAAILYLGENKVYSSTFNTYSTVVGPAFWVDMPNGEAGTLHTFVAHEGAANGVAGTIIYPNNTNLYANIRLVRNL